MSKTNKREYPPHPVNWTKKVNPPKFRSLQEEIDWVDNIISDCYDILSNIRDMNLNTVIKKGLVHSPKQSQFSESANSLGIDIRIQSKSNFIDSYRMFTIDTSDDFIYDIDRLFRYLTLKGFNKNKQEYHRRSELFVYEVVYRIYDIMSDDYISHLRSELKEQANSKPRYQRPL